MSDGDEHTRVVGICDGCGAAFAAMRTSDGDLVPMGSRTGCPCGSTEFSRVDADDVPDSE